MSRQRKARAQRPGVRAPVPLPPPPTGTAVFISIEAWLTRHSRWVLLLLVTASVFVRGTYFLQLNAGPGIDLHRWDQTDMHYYDAWGRQIARGDWLSRSVGVPMHGWQHRVAESYFSKHPDMRATLIEQATAQGGTKTDPDALLWSRWMGGPQFYQDPLYAYLIGLTYRLIGDDVRFVFGWQMGLGVMSTFLIWLLARRFFGELVAACAGALTVLCGPLVYYELFLLRESTIVFAGLGVVWLADRALTRGTWTWFALLGVSLGLGYLLKSSLVLLGFAVAVGIVLHFRGRWPELRMPAAATLAGFALAATPLAARNMAVGAPPLALAGSGGLTFLISNDVTYDPEAGFDIDTPRLAELLGETGGGLLPSVRRLLGAHTFASYATLLWRKWDRAWHWVELPNNENFYYTRVRAPVLAWLPVTFWLVAPAALVGLVLSARRFSRVWLLYTLVGCSVAPLLLFYTLGRFRVALIAAVIPFAAFALVELLRAAADRKYLRVAAMAVSLTIVGSWTGRPLPNRTLIASSYWLGPFYARYEAETRAALAAGDPARAAAAYLGFFQYEPPLAQVASPGDTSVVQVLAEMHAECATFLRAAGQSEKARVQSEKARELLQHLLRLNPANHEARVLLADTLFDDRSFKEAAVAYKEYLQARPNNSTAAMRRGISLLGTQNVDEALTEFGRAATSDPRNARAQWYLTIILMSRREVAAAEEHAIKFVALAPDDPEAHDLLGRIWASQGKLDAAQAQFEKSLQLNPGYQDAREHLKAIGR
jgi:tetratricopeptide (TPR) repeat protein